MLEAASLQEAAATSLCQCLIYFLSCLFLSSLGILTAFFSTSGYLVFFVLSVHVHPFLVRSGGYLHTQVYSPMPCCCASWMMTHTCACLPECRAAGAGWGC